MTANTPDVASGNAGRLREAAELLRTNGNRAKGLDWDALENLHRIGVTSSDIALALAATLEAVDREVKSADDARRRTGWFGQPRLIVGTEYAALQLADAILGTTP